MARAPAKKKVAAEKAAPKKVAAKRAAPKKTAAKKAAPKKAAATKAAAEKAAAKGLPAGHLAEYRRKRDASRTPEPVPSAGGRSAPKKPRRRAGAPSFVIQEHHASSLHWDFRLERDGVLISWALPKGLPLSPKDNHLAVHVEDHPLEYGSFSGEIPRGEYGAGKVSIWDEGTYDLEKWRDDEVIVVLHGSRGRAEGRYVLFGTGQAGGKNWMIHRMDPAPVGFEPMPERLTPMLATPGALPTGSRGKAAWAYEFKWDGVRVLLWVDGGRPRALSRNGNDVTVAYPELREMAEAIGSDRVILDGEVVALDEGGRPSFSRLQHRMHVTSAREARGLADRFPVSMIVFDVLHLNGRSLLASSYDERRAVLEGLGISGPSWGVTPAFVSEPPDDVMRTAVSLGMEGVVCKRRSSPYRPGVRSPDWIKVKHERIQEVVIGGWTSGQGERSPTFGALLLGIPTGAGVGGERGGGGGSGSGRRGGDGRRRGSAKGSETLTYVGKVGTGFTEADRESLLAGFRRAERSTSPFEGDLPSAVARGAHWVRPDQVGEVRFGEWTPDGILRHPVWRGLRADKSVRDVRRES